MNNVKKTGGGRSHLDPVGSPGVTTLPQPESSPVQSPALLKQPDPKLGALTPKELDASSVQARSTGGAQQLGVQVEQQSRRGPGVRQKALKVQTVERLGRNERNAMKGVEQVLLDAKSILAKHQQSE